MLVMDKVKHNLNESYLQSLNEEDPMLVTPSGIVIFVSELQPSNAEDSILVTPSGIVMLVNELQFSNA